MAREKRMSLSRTLILTGLGVATAVLAAPERSVAQDEDDGLPMKFRSNAINMAAGGARRSTRLDITVERWSTEDERAVLVEALKEGNRRALPDALSRQRRDRVGSVREVQRRAEALAYSRRVPGPDGGQQIILANDRPIAFVGQWRGSRTRDYNVTVIILNIDSEGNGEGQLLAGAEIEWDEENQRVTVTNLATQPISLTSVRLQ